MGDSTAQSGKDASQHVRSASRMMVDWQTRFNEKVRTPEQAISSIRSGDKVFVGSGAAEPQILVKALIESAGRLADTRCPCAPTGRSDVGTFLIQSLVKIAKFRNIKGLTAEVLRDNVAAIALMHKSSVEPKSTPVDGSYLFTLDF